MRRRDFLCKREVTAFHYENAADRKAGDKLQKTVSHVSRRTEVLIPFEDLGPSVSSSRDFQMIFRSSLVVE